jgi:hypothetical protein
MRLFFNTSKRCHCSKFLKVVGVPCDGTMRHIVFGEAQVPVLADLRLYEKLPRVSNESPDGYSIEQELDICPTRN